MLDSVSAGDQKSISTRRHIYSEVPVSELVVKSSTSEKLIRSLVARQPVVSALLAMVAGAFAMVIVRNRLKSRPGAHNTANRRRRQMRRKQPS